MSIISDMKPIMLQVKKKIEKPSGAIVEGWKDDKLIDMVLYLTDDMKYTQSVRYNSSSHIGITFYKDLEKDIHRFRDGETFYTIEKISTRGRFTRLLLRAVDTDV